MTSDSGGTSRLRVDGVSFAYPAKRSLFRRQQPEGPTVLKAVSLEIGSGDLFGLVGPNGAGKSTLIKVIIGILEPSEGRIAVSGLVPRDIRSSSWKSEIGFLSGASTKLFGTLALSEHILLYESLYPAFQRDWLESRLAKLGLADKKERTPGGVSFGERIKFEIVLTLACSPRLLLLDEPTVGLDPVAVDEIRGLVAGYVARSGATGIVTSHNLGDITTLCARGGFLEDGCLSNLFDGRKTSVVDLESHYRKVFGRA